MNTDEYQKEANRTLMRHPDFYLADNDLMIVWCALGMGGEAGEVEELVKKGILHKHGLDPQKVKIELGDVLWYIASLCELLGFSLSEVMQTSIDKLYARYPNGFSYVDSLSRNDLKGE